MRKTYPLSEETYKAIGNNREKFAKARGVTRDAVDQLMAGYTHDPYPPFRETFQQAVISGCNFQAWLDDLHSIAELAPAKRQHNGRRMTEVYLESMDKAHEVSRSVVKALEDGDLCMAECLRLIPKISATISQYDEMLRAVMQRKNELSGAIDVAFIRGGSNAA